MKVLLLLSTFLLFSFCKVSNSLTIKWSQIVLNHAYNKPITATYITYSNSKLTTNSIVTKGTITIPAGAVSYYYTAMIPRNLVGKPVWTRVTAKIDTTLRDTVCKKRVN